MAGVRHQLEGETSHGALQNAHPGALVRPSPDPATLVTLTEFTCAA